MSRAYPVAVIVLSIVAVALALTFTTHAIGTTADSVNYIAAAQSLMKGEGYRAYTGLPLVRFPPLYSTLLATPALMGLETLTSARLINALAFGLIVTLSGILFRAALRRRVFALLATIAVASAWPLLLSSIYALSEPVFTLLVLCVVLQLRATLQKPSAANAALLGLLVGFAVLQRYLGATLIPIGIVLLLLSRERRRVQIALTFGATACLLPGLWAFRNLTVAGTLAGSRGSPAVPITRMVEVIGSWFAPGDYAVPVGFAVVLVVAFVALASIRRSSPLAIIAVFTALYLLLFALLSQIMNVSIDHRMLAPIVPGLIAVLAGSAEQVAMWVDRRLSNSIGTRGAVVLLALWLILPISKAWFEVNLLSRSDAWTGFSTDKLRTSPQIQWLLDHPDERLLYSNWPMPVYLHTGRYVEHWPTRSLDNAYEQLGEMADEPAILIIFNTDDARYMLRYDVSGVAELVPLLKIDEGVTGVYRIS